MLYDRLAKLRPETEEDKLAEEYRERLAASSTAQDESQYRAEGRQARRAGKSIEDCPYSYGTQRVANKEWRAGWNLQDYEERDA